MTTCVGLLQLEVMVGGSTSLKDKRRVIKSFKDRLRVRGNVSVAEVGLQDNHRRGVLAVAMVGSDKRYLEGALQHVVNTAEAHRGMIVVDSRVDWL